MCLYTHIHMIAWSRNNKVHDHILTTPPRHPLQKKLSRFMWLPRRAAVGTTTALRLLPVDPALDEVLGLFALRLGAEHLDDADLQGIAILDDVLRGLPHGLAPKEET